MDGPRTGEGFEELLDERLTRHLHGGRTASDIAQGALATLTVFVFWGTLPRWFEIGWLALFIGLIGVRAANRSRVATEVTNPVALRAVIRRDVWLAGAMWGVLAIAFMGGSATNLAILMIVFSGIIAAATSTLVADPRSFHGFMAILLGPMAVAVALSGTTRVHLSLLLLTALFAPFMISVHRRAHALLRAQIEANGRLRVSEEETARGRDFLNALIANAPSSMVVVDSEARVVQANPAFERTTGHGWSEVRGRSLPDLLGEGKERDRLRSFLATIREGARSVAELRLRRADGHEIWMRLSGTSAGQAAADSAILIGEDVTEQVYAREAQEAARIEAEQAARAKSSFLASMSHEIRTPMNGVLGMIELLRDTQLTQQQTELVRVAQTSANALLRILNDILDVSKIEAGQLDLEAVDFDLHGLVGEIGTVFSGQAAARRTELLIDIGPDVPVYANADSLRIRQVLSNLLSNAVKFTEDGDVVLRVTRVGEDRDRARVRFSVSDTGVGIPVEKQERVFAEFEQADQSTTRTHGGTGLGLAISRRLVELLGGRLELDSVPGEGSNFHFELWLSTAAEQPKERRGSPVALRGRRFLVVDDHETARRIVREALTFEGAVVEEAPDVDTGLAILRGAGEGFEFDAVVLDQLMPAREGFELAAEVTADPRLRDLRILMLTSSAAATGESRARDLGIGGYVAKPVSRRDLVRALRSLLGGAPPEDGERRLITTETLATPGRAVRVLVAEDNPVNQQVALALLQKRGYQVALVENGAKAVDAVLDAEYDIVLMDIQMPEMDGLEATRRIRAHAHLADLPIVALTAHAFQEERERTRVAGMNDFLAKPFKPEDLYDMVEKWGGDAAWRDAPETNESDAPAPAPGDERRQPPVDVEAFRSTMRAAGVEEIVDSTLEVFVAEAPKLFDQIEAALASGDAQGVRNAAHGLKSASGNVRADDFAGLLKDLEVAAAADDTEAIARAFEPVRDEYRAVMEYLEAR